MNIYCMNWLLSAFSPSRTYIQFNFIKPNKCTPYSFLYNVFIFHSLHISFLFSHGFRLTVSQRQCRFAHESDILETSPIYSFNLCQNECRMRLALKTCNCIPHFYRSRGKFNFIWIIRFDCFIFSVGLLLINTWDKIVWWKEFNKNNFFYWFTVKRGKKYPVCNFEGIKCLETIKGLFQ